MMKISRFRSKVDPWLGLLLAITAFGPMAIAVYTVLTVPEEVWGVLPAALLPLLIVAWVVRTTHYTFVDDVLVVRSGPIHRKVPLASIDDIKPTRTLVSSPALSLDRLAIRFNRYDAVVISPRDRDAFLAELEQRRGRTHGRG